MPEARGLSGPYLIESAHFFGYGIDVALMDGENEGVFIIRKADCGAIALEDIEIDDEGGKFSSLFAELVWR